VGECGYQCAWRVLDAQHFGLAQRRARVFVVGHLGDWRRAAAVLFERESLSGHPTPRREAGEDAAECVAGSLGSRGNRSHTELDGHGAYVHCADVAPTLNAHFGDEQGLEDQHALNGAGLFVARSLRADGFDASEDGTGRGTPLVPVAFQTRGSNIDTNGEIAGTLGTNADRASGGAPMVAHAFDARQSDVIQYGDQAGPLDTDGHSIAVAFQSSQSGVQQVETHATLDSNNGSRRHNGVAVRRLTPRECERLMGFPDDYTLIPYRGKPAADGPRYKALGNSMAVPCMHWIGRRIQMVDDLTRELEATA